MLNIALLIVGLVLLIIFFKWFWFGSITNFDQFQDEVDQDEHMSSPNKNEHTDTKKTNKFKKIS